MNKNNNTVAHPTFLGTIILVMVLISLFQPKLCNAQEFKDDSKGRWDVLGQIIRLIDDLEYWSENNLDSVNNIDDLYNNMPDTLNLMQYFIGSSIKQDDSTGVFTIEFPTYMVVVNTTIKFSIATDSASKHPSIKWLSPIEVRGDTVLLDNAVS